MAYKRMRRTEDKWAKVTGEPGRYVTAMGYEGRMLPEKFERFVLRDEAEATAIAWLKAA